MSDRIRCQSSIEEVYWAHRLWPEQNHHPKPLYESSVPLAAIEKKVEAYIHKSQILRTYWNHEITGEDLQKELNRMARETRQPEVLKQLFAALENDPTTIAECLARPVLAGRLLENWYQNDSRFHEETRRQAEDDLSQYGSLEALEFAGRDFSVSTLPLPPGSEENAASSLLRIFHSETVSELPIGRVSTLQEEGDRFYAVKILEKNSDSMRIAAVEWRKKPLEDWLREQPFPGNLRIESYNYPYKIPTISSSCTNDNWLPINSSAPEGRSGHTAVWTGSEMIIWGGSRDFIGINSGARYNPFIDVWEPLSVTGAPMGRSGHTAVWTGTEMIVWGGSAGGGGRYDPVSDTWTPVFAGPGAPETRSDHTAVWTGSEMIIWGGFSRSELSNGTRYDPSSDSWHDVNNTGAPTARMNHTAVWTGSKMIIWGGMRFEPTVAPAPESGTVIFPVDAASYDPGSDAWTTISSFKAPVPRSSPCAVWTGDKMVVWGGFDGMALQSGGIYHPLTSGWQATSVLNAPTARVADVCVWTGQEMIVWGGASLNGGTVFGDGGHYNPLTDTWQPTGLTNAPRARRGSAGIWTGSEMIIWGGMGALNTGGRYSASLKRWIPTNAADGVAPTTGHTAIWTGTEMIVWGGSSGKGARYLPSLNSWQATSRGPSGRSGHTAVWTGSRMIIWGGSGLDDGALYDPVFDQWAPTSQAPLGRMQHSAVWTGNTMIVWGGKGSTLLNDGAQYDPQTNSWTAVNTTNAPSARFNHAAVWTGDKMIIWGGKEYSLSFNTGGVYDPQTDSWEETSLTDAPLPNGKPDGFWTGSMALFGYSGLYDPDSKTWTPISTMNQPTPQAGHTAVWTGEDMIIWGGSFNNSGGRYDPVLDQWTLTTLVDAPERRWYHSAVWTGRDMLIWGGWSGSAYTHNGASYSVGMRIVPSGLPAGYLNAPYYQKLYAFGATDPVYFSLEQGELVPGLSVTTSGEVSGIPSEGGIFEFTVRVTDAGGCNASRTYRIIIHCPGLDVIPTSIPGVTVGVPYTLTFAGTGGQSPYSISFAGGTLPNGLTFDGDSITGTTTQSGTFTFVIGVMDAAGCYGERSYTILSRSCIFCDDFENGDLSDPAWTVGSGFQEAGGCLIGTTNKKTRAISPIFVAPATRNVSADVRLTSYNSQLSVYPWYQDNKHFVEVKFIPAKRRILLKQRSGILTSKKKGWVLLKLNQTYELDIAFSGDQIVLIVDGPGMYYSMKPVATPEGISAFGLKSTDGTAATGSLCDIRVY